MNKFFIILLSFFTFTIYSINYGLSIDEKAFYSVNELTNTVKLNMWTRLNIGKNIKFEFQSNLNALSENQPTAPYFFDIDILKFNFLFKRGVSDDPNIVLDIGRFPVLDQTKQILNHKLDGFLLKLNFPKLKIENGLFYSGLIWERSSSITPSKLDNYHLNIESSFLELASPRVIGKHNLKIKNIFEQNISLEFLYQVDLREEDTIDEYKTHQEVDIHSGGHLDTYYLSLRSQGPISLLNDLNYSISYAYNGGRSLSKSLIIDNQELDYYSFSQVSAHLIDFRLNKYFENFFNSYIAYGFLYSSGDKDFIGYYDDNRADLAEMFIPISKSSSGIVFSPSIGNLMVNQLSLSIKPIDDIQTMITTYIFNRTSSGPISESGISPDSKELYLGTELDLVINYRPFSDLGITYITGLYIPSSAYDPQYLTENGDVQVTIGLYISFSL